MTKYTPAPWFPSPLFTEHGATDNNGSVVIMAGEIDTYGDSFPIAHALLTVEAKRGQKHKVDDPARNANAQLICAAPDYDAAAELALSGNMTGAKPSEEYVAIPRAAYDALKAAYDKARGRT